MGPALIATLSVVILLLRHDTVRGQGGHEAERQRQSGRLDMKSWLQANGGKVGWTVGLNPQGVRGTLSSQRYEPGDIISVVPRNCSIDVGPQGWTAPELAVNLLGVQFGNPAKWKFMAPYRQNLPDAYALYGRYTFLPEHLSLLQDDSMADMIKRVRQWLVWVFEGGPAVAGERTFPALVTAFPEAAGATFSDLSYWSALVDMYAFSFENPVSKESHHFLVPAMDMVNYCFDANAEIRMTQDGESFVARAIKNIQPGEEVTHRYSWSIERNDKALMNYFFVHERTPPRLCSVDLPGGSIWDEKEQSPSEEDVGSLEGVPVSKEESDRLTAILASFPTTEDEDRAALSGQGITDWRARTIIDFRVKRKEALHLAIEKIKTALSSSPVGSSADHTQAQSKGRGFAQHEGSAMTSGAKFDGQVPSEDLGVEELSESDEEVAVPSDLDSQEVSSDEGVTYEWRSEEEIQESEVLSGVRRRSAIEPVEGASEGLQEPKFIKIGSASAPVDEL